MQAEPRGDYEVFHRSSDRCGRPKCQIRHRRLRGLRKSYASVPHTFWRPKRKLPLRMGWKPST